MNLLTTSGNRIVDAASGRAILLRGVNRSGLEYAWPDEDGFASVNRLHGISIKVGQGDTQARYRVQDREELLSWLNAIIERIGNNREQS